MSRMETTQGGGVGRWCATGLALLLCAAAWPAARDQSTFAGVADAITRMDSKQAIGGLIALANRGDARAQYWLGLAHLEGKWVEQNVPQAISWLQLAADGYDGSFATSVSAEARETLLKYGPAVSGPDLIKADQITAAFLANFTTVMNASVARARQTLQAAVATPALSIAADPASGVTIGCALDANQGGCAAAAKRLSGERCAGPFPDPDTAASSMGPETDLYMPSYPVEGRRNGWEGKVIVLAHVAGSGFVCRVTLVQGSGFDQIDRAALRAVSRWRLTPAQQRGQPVESFYTSSVNFLLTDLQLK